MCVSVRVRAHACDLYAQFFGGRLVASAFVFYLGGGVRPDSSSSMENSPATDWGAWVQRGLAHVLLLLSGRGRGLVESCFVEFLG